VVAVGVVGADPAEFVAGQLGGLAVVAGGLVFGGGAGERPEFQQQARCLGAVQVAVADDRAVVGALRAAVIFPDLLLSVLRILLRIGRRGMAAVIGDG
jgi:hypothetical protein